MPFKGLRKARVQYWSTYQISVGGNKLLPVVGCQLLPPHHLPHSHHCKITIIVNIMVIVNIMMVITCEASVSKDRVPKLDISAVCLEAVVHLEYNCPYKWFPFLTLWPSDAR